MAFRFRLDLVDPTEDYSYIDLHIGVVISITNRGKIVLE